MFTKEERSTFKYWFAHWCAFQMTALNLKCWKFRFLFHDIEKPWLRLLFKGNYKKVQQWHRRHNSHHLEYFFNKGKADWLAMVIDCECSRFTKEAGQLNAVDTLTITCKELNEKFKNDPKNLQKVKTLTINFTKILKDIKLK